jgi:Lon protease-like protein
MGPALPLFPLGTVLLPGLVLPLHVFEDRYRALVRRLMDLPEGTPREFGVVAIQQGWEVERTAVERAPSATGQRTPVSLYDIGCSAELRQVTELDDGGFNIVTVGRRRFRLGSVDTDTQPYLTADVEWLPEGAGEPGVADALAPGVLAVFQRYLGRIRAQTDQTGEQLPDDPTVLSYLIAASTSLTLDDRQHLLALPDTAARLRAERGLLTREVAILDQVRAVPVPLAELAVPSSPN